MKRSRKAPTLLINADGKKVHPLVQLARDMPTKDIAKLLGHSNHTTASIYVGRARKRPSTTIPAEWCLKLAEALDVTPATLRPDLYRPEWRLPARDKQGG